MGPSQYTKTYPCVRFRLMWKDDAERVKAASSGPHVRDSYQAPSIWDLLEGN